jgi:uncharacterized protein (TIGR03437 family)
MSEGETTDYYTATTRMEQWSRGWEVGTRNGDAVRHFLRSACASAIANASPTIDWLSLSRIVSYTMRVLVSLLFSSVALTAAPQLKLSNFTTYDPINVEVGQNGPTQSVSATNIGDGTLSIGASASVPWIATSIVGTKVQIALNTASLAKGIYTGIVTVTAVNAIDSPQSITVTVQIGGGVPDAIDFYVGPNGPSPAPFTFYAANGLTTAVANPQISFFQISLYGVDPPTFSTAWGTARYAAAVVRAGGTPETSITGSFQVTTSLFPPDVGKNVPVTLNITAMPIVDLTPPSLSFNVAQGASPVQKEIVLRNFGTSPLVVTEAAVSSGAPWLTTTVIGPVAPSPYPYVLATADPTGLPPGKYTATITVASNAKNGTITVPFEMDVVAVGPPFSYYQGVVDNATFQVGAAVAPGGLVIIRGEQFTLGPSVSAQTLPLGTSLGGATVYVDGVAAPIYYVAASHVLNQGGQITFQIPYDTPAGQAAVRVDRNDNGVVQTGNTISVQVQNTAPKLLLATLADYTQISPPEVGPTRFATAGDLLIFFGLGFGQTSPPATEGIAAAGLATVTGAVMVFGDGSPQNPKVSATPSYCGLTPGSVGLYQVNVTVPAGIQPASYVPVSLSLGSVTSNSLPIAVQ